MSLSKVKEADCLPKEKAACGECGQNGLRESDGSPEELLSVRERALAIVSRLEEVYPEAKCSLSYSEPYQLLIATRLSAQCTDARVNTVTPELFSRFPSLEALADAELSAVEEIIKPCGLFRTKAKSIVGLCRELISRYGGEVPDSMEELLTLPGIGRKTANLILGDVFGRPAVVCDTHCMRICERLGLSTGRDAYKVELRLREVLPMDRASDFCHRLVMFGRQTCTARKPVCGSCPLSDLCEKAGSEG